jgi:hypothetical protein
MHLRSSKVIMIEINTGLSQGEEPQESDQCYQPAVNAKTNEITPGHPGDDSYGRGQASYKQNKTTPPTRVST